MIAAVVPAAGESLRMGRPKLILNVAGESVLRRVLSALHDGGVDEVVVVVPPDGAPGSAEMVAQAEMPGVAVLIPDGQPADMRASVELGLSCLELDAEEAGPPTMVLIAPADSPGLTAATVAEVIKRAVELPDRIVVPTYEGRRGHPIALPWDAAEHVRWLPEGVGVNALLAALQAQVVEVAVDDPSILVDMDTPEDYAKWSGTEADA